MKKIEMVKAVGGLVISAGVAAIVGNTVKASTPANIGAIKKLCIVVGSFVLSDMISDKAVAHAEKKVDDGIASLKEALKNEEEIS